MLLDLYILIEPLKKKKKLNLEKYKEKKIYGIWGGN